MVFETVRNRTKAPFENMGEQTVKHVTAPVRVWRWAADQSVERLNPEAAAEARPALALPDKPSIAVLPFDNMSGDPEQEYSSDGITEDIITDLSKVSALFVIARNSSFTYKGKVVDVKQIAADLGVRYVLEGSVRKEPNVSA